MKNMSSNFLEIPNSHHSQDSSRRLNSCPNVFYNHFVIQLEQNHSSLNHLNISKMANLKRGKNSNTSKNIMKIKSQSFLHFCIRNMIYPTMIAFLLIFLFLILEENFDLICWNPNTKAKLFSAVRETFTKNSYFFWISDQCLFDSSEFKNKILFSIYLGFVRLLMLILSIITSPIFSFFPFNTLGLDNYLVPFGFQILSFFIASTYLKINFKKTIKKIKIVFLLLCLALIDHIILRFLLLNSIFFSLKEVYAGQIIFQSFLLLFYQIYGKLAIEFLKKTYSKRNSKAIISKNSILCLIKYYLSLTISSSIVFPATREKLNMSFLFSFFGYFLQLLNLYRQRNVFHYFSKFYRYFYEFFFKKKSIKANSNLDNYLNKLMGGCTNEVVNIVVITFLIDSLFKRNILFPLAGRNDDYNQTLRDDYCKKNIDKSIEISMENLCILFGINFFLFSYLSFKMKDNGKIYFIWKIENYSLFIKSFFVVLLIFNTDLNFQFYLYLHSIKRQS